MTLLFIIWIVAAFTIAIGIGYQNHVYYEDSQYSKGTMFLIRTPEDILFSIFIACAPVINVVFIYFVWADVLLGSRHWLIRVLMRLFTGKSWKKQ
jgi:hypothetical protein